MNASLEKLLKDSAVQHHLAEGVMRDLAHGAKSKELADEAKHLEHLADLQRAQHDAVVAYINQSPREDQPHGHE